MHISFVTSFWIMQEYLPFHQYWINNMSMYIESSKMLIMNRVVIMDTEVDMSILFLENFMPSGPFFEQISVINLNLQPWLLCFLHGISISDQRWFNKTLTVMDKEISQQDYS